MIVNASSKESLEFREIGFEIEKTKDDSPTLRMINGTDRGGESMHHTGGAFSETCLIYGQAFDYGFRHHPNPTIVSLGLGLGYVEVLAAVFALKHNSSGWKLLSYEIVIGLKKMFQEFYLEGRSNETYEWILRRMGTVYSFNVDEIRHEVKHALQEGRLILKGNFAEEYKDIQSFDVFCYDAYSKKTSPELWDENLMTQIFSHGSAKSCVSSYASNGVLKRSLAQAGFQVEVLEGFQGKRNRTWAFR